MENVKDGGYRVGEGLDIADIDPGLSRLCDPTTTQLIDDRDVESIDVAAELNEPTTD